MGEGIKLIINIPDNDYRHIKEYYEKNDIVEATYSYIYHGIPLDDVLNKISAEIDEKISHYEHFSSSNTANGLMIAKEIIEKYKGDKE